MSLIDQSVERDYLVDTGASTHMIGKNLLTYSEKKTKRLLGKSF